MRNWRPFTWAVLIVNLLFLIWLIGGIGSGVNEADCEQEATRALRDACEAGTAVGAGIAAGFIIFLWALVDIILGVVWLVTNRGRRDCPTCGRAVKKGQTVCKSCGHDFRTGTAPAAT